MTTTKDVQPSSAQSDEKTETGKPEEDNTFYCEICKIACLTPSIFDAHCQGEKHKKMKTMMHEDDPKEGQKSEELKVHSQARNFRQDARFLKIYAYMTNRDPLIGLQHVIENTIPDSTEPRFTCDLCEYCSDLGPLIDHLNSFEHRKAYIAKEYPFLLKVPPAQNEDRVTFLKRMALDIERDEGVKMYRSEILQDDALHFLKTFDVDSDEEAFSIMTLTQNLSETLKTYCLQKTNAEKAANVANTFDEVNSFNPPSTGSLRGGNSQMPFDSQNMHCSQQASPSVTSVDLSQEATFQSQLSQQVPFTAGMDNWGRETVQNQNFQPAQSVPMNASQFTFSLDRSSDAKPTGNPQNSYGRILNDSELRPFAPNEPRGPGGLTSESHAFGNKYSLSDRGPLAGSLAGGPSPHSISDHVPEYQAYRNNLLTPSANFGRSASWIQDPDGRYVRDRDHGSRYEPTSGGFGARLSSSYDSRPSNSFVPPHADPLRASNASNIYRGLPRTMADGGRRERDSLYIRDFPKVAPLDHRSSEMFFAGIGTRTSTGNSIAGISVRASDLPRGAMPDMPTQGATSVLASDILTLIKGKDVKSASKILTNLAPTHPTLKKANIAHLLNLLVETGTIKKA